VALGTCVTFWVFLELLTVCNLLCAATFVFADLGLIKACCVPVGRDATGQGCAGRWVLEGLDCVCVCVCVVYVYVDVDVDVDVRDKAWVSAGVRVRVRSLF
jgi:hypothetical protein